jgi:molybdopterin biosynthesis enzyme
MPVQTVGAGECIEIATGAPMPAGADAVVIVEETDSDGDIIRVFASVNPAQNVGRQGSDIQKGQTVLQPGRCSMQPRRISGGAGTH